MEKYRLTAESSAPSFFVSEERALELLRYRQRNGRWPERTLPLQVARNEEICRRVGELRERDRSLSLPMAVRQVVDTPAPSFYVNSDTVRHVMGERHKRHCRSAGRLHPRLATNRM